MAVKCMTQMPAPPSATAPVASHASGFGDVRAWAAHRSPNIDPMTDIAYASVGVTHPWLN
ncbi:hypothetical protein GCM10027167_38890 [Nocardia heshunensis]